jgi:uncharacterized membrane protein YebE (DUF533 family)
MNRTFIIAASLLSLTATGALADRAADRIDTREAAQEQRIQAARRSGDLTFREKIALEREQAQIRNMERRAKADGHIDRREAAAIERAQDAASRHIYQEAHDNQKSWWRR